jgi:hypothetical protein
LDEIMARYSVKSIVSGALILVASAFTLNAAHAAKPQPTLSGCSFGNTLFNGVSGAGVTTSIDCELYGNTNDNHNNDIPDLDPFGIEDWVLSDKKKGDGTDDGGAGPILLSYAYNQNSDHAGTWSVDSFHGYTDVFLTLKAGNGFVAYLLDTTQTSGFFTTFAEIPDGSGNAGKELSHMSLFYSPDSLTAVPLPAALPLYAAGVAILGFLGYRRRKA